MSLVRWKTSHFKSSETPTVISKHQKRRAAEQALQEAYDAVDLRDGGVCCVTGHWTQPGAVMPILRREHHHLKGRRVRPEWRDKPERIITVCKAAHDLITQGWIVVEGCDARKPNGIRFHWAEWVKPEQKPFRIKSRRWSQQEQG